MPLRLPGKRHKYGAKPIVVDGIRFASTKEGARYRELRLLEKAGKIHKLQLQPGFALAVPGRFLPSTHPLMKLGDYRADFAYCECERGDKCELTRVVVEDVKGFKTPLYRWKKRHVEAQYGIQIKEI